MLAINYFTCGAVTRELPGNYPFVVQKLFIQSIVKDWEVPSCNLSASTYNTLLEQILGIVNTYFEQYDVLKRHVS